MTQEQKRIKIAEACGIEVCEGCFNAIDTECCCCGSPMEGHSYYDGHSPTPMGCRCGYDKQPQPRWRGVPDYLNDLNAMHEAEKVLFGKVGWVHYSQVLLLGNTHATAAQRAEAFGRTLNLWTE